MTKITIGERTIDVNPEACVVMTDNGKQIEVLMNSNGNSLAKMTEAFISSMIKGIRENNHDIKEDEICSEMIGMLISMVINNA